MAVSSDPGSCERELESEPRLTQGHRCTESLCVGSWHKVGVHHISICGLGIVGIRVCGRNGGQPCTYRVHTPAELARHGSAARSPWHVIDIVVGVLVMRLLAGVGLTGRSQFGAHNRHWCDSALTWELMATK